MAEKKWVKKPHKGGRDAKLNFRIRSDVKEILVQIAKKEDCSMADIIERWTLEHTQNEQ